MDLGRRSWTILNAHPQFGSFLGSNASMSSSSFIRAARAYLTLACCSFVLSFKMNSLIYVNFLPQVKLHSEYLVGSVSISTYSFGLLGSSFLKEVDPFVSWLFDISFLYDPIHISLGGILLSFSFSWVVCSLAWPLVRTSNGIFFS